MKIYKKKFESSPTSQAPNVIKEALDIVKALLTTHSSVERLFSAPKNKDAPDWRKTF